MNSPLLEKISQPSDLKKLSSQQTVQLCAEIREFLLDKRIKDRRPSGIQSGCCGADGGSAPGADYPHG